MYTDISHIYADCAKGIYYGFTELVEAEERYGPADITHLCFYYEASPYAAKIFFFFFFFWK